MPEFNLLQSFPKVKRGRVGRVKDDELLKTSQKQGFDYYDGERKYGFGGYNYDGRWREVAKLAKERYSLNPDSKVLVDRSDKGFLVYDLKELIPGIEVYGIHPSEYSINNSMDGFGKLALINRLEEGDLKSIEQEAREKIAPFLIKADITNLPFRDNYFDTVISINSICNYPETECRKAVREIIRVSKDNGKNSYIHTDSWRTQAEKETMEQWVLLCKTFLDTEGWKKLYEEEGFKGDWGFIIFDSENY